MLVAGRRGNRDCVVCCEESARERDGEEKSLMDGSFEWWRSRQRLCVVFIEGALKSIG